MTHGNKSELNGNKRNASPSKDDSRKLEVTPSIADQSEVKERDPNQSSGGRHGASTQDTQTPGRKWNAPPMPDNKSMAETEIPEKANLQTDEKTPPAPALPKNRFSRRFGEIPLVG